MRTEISLCEGEMLDQISGVFMVWQVRDQDGARFLVRECCGFRYEAELSVDALRKLGQELIAAAEGAKCSGF